MWQAANGTVSHLSLWGYFVISRHSWWSPKRWSAQCMLALHRQTPPRRVQTSWTHSILPALSLPPTDDVARSEENLSNVAMSLLNYPATTPCWQRMTGANPLLIQKLASAFYTMLHFCPLLADGEEGPIYNCLVEKRRTKEAKHLAAETSTVLVPLPPGTWAEKCMSLEVSNLINNPAPLPARPTCFRGDDC